MSAFTLVLQTLVVTERSAQRRTTSPPVLRTTSRERWHRCRSLGRCTHTLPPQRSIQHGADPPGCECSPTTTSARGSWPTRRTVRPPTSRCGRVISQCGQPSRNLLTPSLLSAMISVYLTPGTLTHVGLGPPLSFTSPHLSHLSSPLFTSVHLSSVLHLSPFFQTSIGGARSSILNSCCRQCPSRPPSSSRRLRTMWSSQPFGRDCHVLALVLSGP